VPPVIAPYLKVLHPLFIIVLLLAFLAGWLYGGGRLLHGALRKATGQRRLSLGRCVLAMLLSGAAGVFAGGVLFKLISAIGNTVEVNLIIPAAIVALVALVSLAYLVLAVMFPLSWKQMLQVSARPFAGMLALVILLGIVGGIPAYFMGQRVFKEDSCRARLRLIHQALVRYERKYASRQAPTLQALSDEGLIRKAHLVCPAAEERAIGYFYLPGESVPNDKPTNTLRACDLRDNHGPGSRGVLLANGDVMRPDEEAFEELLALPENAAFAAALREAEGP